MSSYREIVELEQKYLLNTYARYPVAFARGKGVYLFDVDGKRYLDFLSGLGVNALGHAHPRIVKVIREQAARVIHLSNLYYNEYQGQLAEKLCQKSGLDRAFFTNSGTEAIEGAIKLVRAAGHATAGPRKTTLIALENSFHGRTMGALALTAQDKYRRFRSHAGRRVLRAAQRRCGPARGSGRQRLRHRAGADPGRRRDLRFVSGIFAGLPPTGRSASRRAGLRRDPVWHGTHRSAVRLRAFRRCARRGLHRQADGGGLPHGRIPVERLAGAVHHTGTSRYDVWRRAAGLPCCAGISGDSRRRKSSGTRAPRGRLPHAQVAGTGREVFDRH